VVFRDDEFSATLFSSLENEQKIRDLCAKISSHPEGSEQFWQALLELRDTLEVHIAELREKVATAGKVTSSQR